VSPTFADLGVPPSIASNLAARGIEAPFPIQAATIPDALAGRDICGRAPTGSGKTIAFGIPLVNGVGKASPKRPRGLVLVPTRELASQVCDELNILAKPKGPWVEAFYGGVGFDKQLRALNKGVDIAVACPGRLADLINQRRMSLEDVEFVVIDEADRMADMGFLPEVKRILDQCRDDHQTLLFSATLDGDVDVLIKKYQKDPLRHEFHADEEDISRSEHLFWHVERSDRLKTAAAIVSRMGPTVVFCRTKRGADRIAKQLDDSGVRSAAIHGDRSQSQRERALDLFHRGRVQALVATDVAARGIHVDGVECVIHFDPPADFKDYTHRSGRTARAGANGVVISLVPGELKKAVFDLQKDLGFPKGLTPIDFDELDELASRESAVASVAKTAARASRHGESSHSAAPARPRPADRDRGPRAGGATHNASRSEHRSRPERAERHDRDAAPRTDRDRSPSSDRNRPAASTRSARPEVAALPEHSRAHGSEVGVDGRIPLAPGQKRPSGAARRKAKKLSQIEATRLERVIEDDDLRDGRSSREAKIRTPRPGRPAGPAKGGPGTKGAKPGAGRAKAATSGRAPAPKRSSSGRSGGQATRSSAGRRSA
jgi:superfamily II DNA/RNA helicase